MIAPTISFKHTDTNVDHAREQLLVTKLAPLQKYYQEPTLISVEFRQEATKNSDEMCVTEVNCVVKGTMYRATARTESFAKSIDVVRNELDKELRRAHKKRNSLFRKGARRIKDIMRWGK